MWIEYQPNPCGRSVGDCSVRAISAALGVDWETAYNILADAGYKMCDMPSANATIAAVLRQHGFYKGTIPSKYPENYTAADFAEDHQNGTFVLFFGNHVATIIDGDLLDAWNSSREIPQFFWYRKDE